MNNLQAVSFVESSFGPAAANCDGVIEFHRYAVAFELQMFDELRQGRAVRTFLWLAIDDHGHNRSVVERKKASENRRPLE